MNKTSICDYSDFDYNTEFWTDKNREYEYRLEQILIKNILKKHAKNRQSICDAGCGFGRLVTSYNHIFKECHLVDYAENLLNEAKRDHGDNNGIFFYKQSLYDLNLPFLMDAIISIRTLHHLDNIDELLDNFSKNLNNDGILIVDIPNHYHIKNRIKRPLIAKKNKVKLSKSYFNYDPEFIIRKLKTHGFIILETTQVGLFRIDWIKRMFPHGMLISIEMIINRLLSSINIGPSVYVVAKKKCG